MASKGTALHVKLGRMRPARHDPVDTDFIEGKFGPVQLNPGDLFHLGGSGGGNCV